MLSELLDQVLTQPPSERRAWLDDLAHRDGPLARELEELLAALPDAELSGSESDSTSDSTRDSASEHASEHEHEFTHGSELTSATASELATDADVDEPRVGEVIGGCRLTALLGRGGVGTVFAADQLDPPRPVAVKVLRTGSTRPSHLRRFRTEAMALARLEHPAIVRIYATGVASRSLDGRVIAAQVPYIVMERVAPAANFVDWARRLRKVDTAHDASRDLREIAACMAEVCDGMQQGHSRGLLHRDLKPSNVLVAPNGRVKIIDFGVARLVEQGSLEAIETLGTAIPEDTVVGALIGTPAYMAPEQFELPPSEIDIRADIHAVGVMLYEAVTGRRPYEIPRHLYFDAARIVREATPTPLERCDSTVPRDFSAIVAKAMAKDRTKRYATMAELADDLRAFVAGRAVRARPESAGERVVRWVRRNPAWTTAIAVTSLVLLASTLFTAISWKRASHQLMLASLERAATSSRELNMQDAAARIDELRDAARGQIPEFIFGMLAAPFDGAVRQYAEQNHGHRMAGTLSPDRTRWIASGDGGVVHVVDLVTHAVVEARVPSDPAFSWACGFSPDGDRTFVGCEKGIYEVLADGRCEARWETPLGQVRGFAPTTRGPRGMYLFAGSQAIARFVPEGPAESEQVVLPRGTAIGSIVCAGDRMYAAAADGNFYALNIDGDGKVVVDQGFRPPPGRGVSVTVTSDGALLARGLYDGRVQILNPRTGAVFAEDFVRHDVFAVAFTPSGAHLYAGDRGGRVHRYRIGGTSDAPTLEATAVQRTQSTDPVWAIGAINETEVVANVSFGIYRFDFSPAWAPDPQPFPGGSVVSLSRFDGRTVRALGGDGRVYELDLANGVWSQVSHGELGMTSVQSGKLSADGTAVVAWDGNQLVVRDLRDGMGATLDAPNAAGRPIFAWSPEGERVVCVLSDRVALLDRQGAELDVQQVPIGLARIAEWFVDPKTKQNRVAICAISGVYSMHEVAVDERSLRMVAKHDSGQSVLWRGDRFVQPELSGPIRIFARGGLDAAFQAPQTILRGHFDVARAIDIAPSGEWLVSGGEDGTVRVWNIALAECFLPLSGPGGKMQFVQWAPDERSILAVDQFGRVRFFDSVARHERLREARQRDVSALP